MINRIGRQTRVKFTQMTQIREGAEKRDDPSALRLRSGQADLTGMTQIGRESIESGVPLTASGTCTTKAQRTPIRRRQGYGGLWVSQRGRISPAGIATKGIRHTHWRTSCAGAPSANYGHEGRDNCKNLKDRSIHRLRR